jgi:signal transduction histidine kinase
MTSPPPDPKWPRLLGLSVHEFRSPLTVVSGYIRMLLNDTAGPVTERQRQMLEAAAKSCARMNALLTETSDLSNLEAGTVSINRSSIDLRKVLADVIAALPANSDREVEVELATGDGPATIQGDAVRLRTALGSVLFALRRELVTSSRIFVRERSGDYKGRPASWIAIGDADQIDALATAAPNTLTTFDEWRGGCGLSLAVARRIVEAHGGAVWSPLEGSKAGAVIALPH